MHFSLKASDEDQCQALSAPRRVGRTRNEEGEK